MDTDERRISDVFEHGKCENCRTGPDEPLYLVSIADMACGCLVGASIWFVAGLAIVLAGTMAVKG